MTPTKEEILERALEQYHKDNPHILTNPEESELRESGYLIAAQQELMMSETRKHAEYLEIEKTKDREPLETEPLQFDVSEAMASGIFISGTSGSGKTNLGFHIAERLIQQAIIVYVVDPSQAWQKSNINTILTIPQPTKPTQISWQAKPTIFDISMLYVKDQRKFTELFCRELFTVAVQGFKPQTFIIFEDAQNILPNHGLRANVYQEAMRLVTTGRNFNIRYALITQFPSMVDKTCVKMTKQRYFGWTNEKNDKDYLRSFLGDKVNELETLEVGQFLYDYGKTTKKVQVPLFQAKTKPEVLGVVM